MFGIWKNVASTWSKKANASKNCVTEGIDINCSRFIWLWHDSNCILFDSLIQLRMLCKRVKNSLKTCSYPLSSVRYGIEIVIKEVRHFFFRHKSHKMNRQNVITAFNKKKERETGLTRLCVCLYGFFEKIWRCVCVLGWLTRTNEWVRQLMCVSNDFSKNIFP